MELRIEAAIRHKNRKENKSRTKAADGGGAGSAEELGIQTEAEKRQGIGGRGDRDTQELASNGWEQRLEEAVEEEKKKQHSFPWKCAGAGT